MRLLAFLAPLLLLVSACSNNQGGLPMTPGTQAPARLQTKVEVPVDLRYLVALPPGFEAKGEKRWPLLLFLHGSGERGPDFDRLKIHGPPSFVETDPLKDFIVISPQCPPGKYWEVTPLLALLDEVEAAYPVDRRRVYVTGLSMGGWGTWALITAAPERFAAAAPIAGWGLSDLAENAKSVPVWAFHGAKDQAVPLAWHEEMITALKAAGGDARLTIYPEAGHNSWTRTYRNPELYAWLLSKQLPEAK